MIEPSDQMMTQYRADALAEREFDICCDCDRGACTEPAVWIFWRVLCCSAPPPVILVCLTHRRWLDGMGRAECTHCRRIFEPAITGFYRIEPLHPSRER